MEPIFSDLFPTVDKAAWLTQVQKELNNARTGDVPYERLRWHVNDGFTIEPYYTHDDLNELPLETIQHAQKPFPGWLTAPAYVVTNEKQGNTVLRNHLANGADALVIALSDPSNLAHLLNGIKLSDTPVFFRTDNSTQLVATLNTIAPYRLRGGLLVDPAAHWIQSNQQLTTGYQSVVDLTKATSDSPQFRTVCATSHPFHNAGATATQELAFLFASLADQYDYLTDAGLSIDQIVTKTILSVSVGISYFIEIAKLRALRVLMNRFNSCYSSAIDTVPLIHGQTSTFYDATATPYTNLLRGTTEAMSAVIGGCDVLTVRPFDAVLTRSSASEASAFSDRIARNVSTLLKEESYLNKVADPSAGSYYIEYVTHQLIEAAWTLFLDIEKRGGFAKAFTDGFIPAQIEQAYHDKVAAVRNGNVIVGVTKFRFDEPTNQLNTDAEGQSTTSLLPDRRLAAEFE
ncbi:methylmalonyl-CoA mutase family protein [Spirosoma agri]|uniref:Methylmalonyl-CoA mutase n=1 Tax=Spirosoma agri TaxID=1987381 RepID=A0A6M0ILA9_9BACT|nr:methylmalonyl-CoA mutase family protein [Spirosoma agri]NEU69090.1 methylmalonyl-CoA mutase [Spirosoma agri]